MFLDRSLNRRSIGRNLSCTRFHSLNRFDSPVRFHSLNRHTNENDTEFVFRCTRLNKHRMDSSHSRYRLSNLSTMADRSDNRSNMNFGRERGREHSDAQRKRLALLPIFALARIGNRLTRDKICFPVWCLAEALTGFYTFSESIHH